MSKKKYVFEVLLPTNSWLLKLIKKIETNVTGIRNIDLNLKKKKIEIKIPNNAFLEVVKNVK